jgi:hypothetical protein
MTIAPFFQSETPPTQALVVHTLRAVQPAMTNSPHSFQLFGFDVGVDALLTPFLEQVGRA